MHVPQAQDGPAAALAKRDDCSAKSQEEDLPDYGFLRDGPKKMVGRNEKRIRRQSTRDGRQNRWPKPAIPRRKHRRGRNAHEVHRAAQDWLEDGTQRKGAGHRQKGYSIALEIASLNRRQAQ
jgi:hypothetical protein